MATIYCCTVCEWQGPESDTSPSDHWCPECGEDCVPLAEKRQREDKAEDKK